MDKITSIEAAKRLAHAIVSDILLYNEEKVVSGLVNDNFFDVLKDEINEGRQLFNERVSDSIANATHLFDAMIVDVLIKGKGESVDSTIW